MEKTFGSWALGLSLSLHFVVWLLGTVKSDPVISSKIFNSLLIGQQYPMLLLLLVNFYRDDGGKANVEEQAKEQGAKWYARR